MNPYSISKQPQDVMHQIAQRVKKLRRKQKITQQEMADRSGVSLGSIRRFETSGRISFESLLAVAHVLNRLDDFDLLFPEDADDDIERLFSERTRS